jgi:pimeloyl-ACP methyl ester carboxylesterase
VTRTVEDVHVRLDGPDDAPVLLLLHGFSGSLHWFDALVDRLRDSFRVVRVDLLGHGDTGGPAADAPEQAAAVAAELDRLGVVDVTAIGHSFGADVACTLAETSTRVTRLVIVCQAPDYSSAHLPRGRTLMTLPVVAPVLHNSARLAARGLAAVLTRRDPAQRDLAARAVRDFTALDTRMFHVVLVQRRDRMLRRPLDAQVRAAAKPTLAIVGGQDHFYGDRYVSRYRSAGARIELLPDSGHSPVMDHPEETAALIRAFVAEPADAQSSN